MASMAGGLFSFLSRNKKKHTEITKMFIRRVDEALADLYSSLGEKVNLLLYSTILVVQMKNIQFQLRFLEMFFWFFPFLECHENLLSSFISIPTTIEDVSSYEQLESIAPKLKWMIQECKAEINKKYTHHLISSCSLNSNAFTPKEIVKSLDFIHGNMNHLFKPGESQIKALAERLFLLRNLIHFTVPRSVEEDNYASKEAQDFEFFVYDMANKAARLTILHWLSLNDEEQETGEKLQRLHLELLQKTPDFIRFCFGLIQVPKVRFSDTLIFGEFLSRFLDFFLENIVSTLKDDVPMLREGLILLITFLADPPPANASMDHHSDLSFFLNKIHAILDMASHTISLFGETSMDLAIGRTNVVHLQKSIAEVREEIGKIYVQIPCPSWSNFPTTNGVRHFEFLLVYIENLKETMDKNKKLVPFLKHRIFTIKEELTPLRQLLQDIWKTQNKHQEVKDLCEQITNLSYQSDLAIKSSFFIDHPIWYNLICLTFVVEKFKDIRSNVMRIKDICKTEVPHPLMSSVVVLKTQTSTSIVENVVGFKHETEVLIDRLTRGTAKVDIVSIVGMGGIGKTTLAKKLFNEPSIRYHFHKRAFCNVSQEYKKRNVLLDILSDLCAIDDEIRQKSDADLAHLLKKCISGCKYLIVMDDIWDIDVWYDVRSSFPDNNNGSRVIFTTRINNISLIAKPDSIPYLLPFLSVGESWELLKQNIFHKDPCPPHLSKVGKLIAKKCAGLPLAIVVIAGLLSRKELHLCHWSGVADALTTLASSEGCKDAIRLSYNRLSEPLKSCFLYLGAFREDEKIDAKMLTNLWVAEGFVLKSKSSYCLRNVAKQYINELCDINLVTVTRRSCNGGIRQLHMHDLIRDFCRAEAQEQHYWYFFNSHNMKVSMPTVYGQYRVCTEVEWRSFVDSKPTGPTLHSLLHYSNDYCNCQSLESVLCNFKLIQVLDFRMIEIFEGFPITVTMLVHLRYLALGIVTSTVKVPSEISNIWNLETLLIFGSARYCLNVEFPSSIWKMKRLRHVETCAKVHVELDDVVSEGVLSQLADLETFLCLWIPPRKAGEELLRRLPNVRKLSCVFDGMSPTPKLDVLTSLESLQMRDYSPTFIEYCTYTFIFPSTIKKLTLESFKPVSFKELNAVIRNQLPNLRVLVLRLITTPKNDTDVQDEEFPNIISLTLDGLDIKEWKASIDSFPCIHELKLSKCSFIEVPPCFGEVPALKYVMVKNCNKGIEDSILQIQKYQLDSGNEINLEIMGV